LDTQLYQWSHFFHFLVAAIWVGVGATVDGILRRVGRMEPGEGRVAEYKRARRYTMMFEMPALTVILIAGVLMITQDLAKFKEPWFSMKLLFVILIVILAALAMVKQRQVGDLLESDGAKGALGAYQWMRVGMVAAAIGLIFCVTFRFGAPAVPQ
jgi:uncharacterized membrane protein SirB2